jgi:hypothetical protein
MALITCSGSMRFLITFSAHDLDTFLPVKNAGMRGLMLGDMDAPLTASHPSAAIRLFQSRKRAAVALEAVVSLSPVSSKL